MKNFQIKSAFSAFLLLLSLTVVSCRDDDDDNAVEPIPTATITITSPTEGAMVMANDSLTISGTIAGEQTIHGYTIYVRKKADNSVLFNKEVHDHKANITINQKWGVGAVTGHTELELEVVATLDHEGHTTSKKVNFHGMP
jgi:hypothetical protein